MIPRATLVAVLIGVEAAIAAGMAGAVRGGMPNGTPAWSFAAVPDPAVAVDIGHADLTIETRPGARISVAVVPGVQIASSGPIVARDDRGTIRITAPESGRSSRFYVDDRNVHVIVPPSTRVIVERAGDIIASGLRAAASFDSPRGRITVRDFRGELTATSSDGRIEISDADCSTLKVAASNGRVAFKRVWRPKSTHPAATAASKVRRCNCATGAFRVRTAACRSSSYGAPTQR